jgi:hypothetical protein
MQAAQPKKHAVVTLAIGEKYLAEFNRRFRPYFERYADRIGAELVVIDGFIEKSDKRAPWQKLLLFDHPDVRKYDRAMFMDGDIYITRHASNPFDVCGDKPWAICDDNPYDLPWLWEADKELYRYCPPENRPSRMLNSGVYIVDKSIKPLLEHVYRDYPEQHCCDNGPLSYHLLNDTDADGQLRGVVLSSEYNRVVATYRNAFGKGLSVILRMIRESSFIHFAGNKGYVFLPFIKWVDNGNDSFLKRFIFWLGQEKFDGVTASLIRLIEKIYAIYNYHVKRKFMKLFAKGQRR